MQIFTKPDSETGSYTWMCTLKGLLLWRKELCGNKGATSNIFQWNEFLNLSEQVGQNHWSQQTCPVTYKVNCPVFDKQLMHPEELKSRSKLHLWPWLRDAGLALVYFWHWGVTQPTSYPGKQRKDAYMLGKCLSAQDFPFPRHLLEHHAFPSSCKRNTVLSLVSLVCKHQLWEI